MPRHLAPALAALERRFGPAGFPVAEPFALVLFEQVAYLASDEKRGAAFAALAQRVGVTPAAILGAAPAILLEIAALGGINAPERALRLKHSAAIVLEECAGDLGATLRGLPLAAARKLARRFDSFGAANGETLLLFAGVPVPALDSNGVRVLARFWSGGESGRYAQDHRRACARIASEGPHDARALLRAFVLLRRHGKTLCRRTAPDCAACPLRATCAFPG